MSPRTTVGSVVFLGTGLVGACFVALMTVAGRLLVPVVVQQAVDGDAVTRWLPRTLAVSSLVGAGIVLVLALIVIVYLVNARLIEVTEYFLEALRRTTFRAMRQEAARTVVTGSGPSVRDVVDDVEQVSQFVRWNGPRLLVNITMLVVTGLLMLVYSWQLGLLVVAVFVLLVPAQRRYLRRLSALQAGIRRLTVDVHARLVEVVLLSAQGAAHGPRGRVAAEARLSAVERDALEVRRARADAAGLASAELATAIAMAATVVGGTLLAHSGNITLGRFVGFLLMLTTIASPVQMIVGALPGSIAVAAGWGRLSRVLPQQPSPPVVTALPSHPLR